MVQCQLLEGTIYNEPNFQTMEVCLSRKELTLI